MAKVAPDFTLERDGVPLAEWLWRLVSESRDTRDVAAERIQAMYVGAPTVYTDVADIEPLVEVKEQIARFTAGVRSIVAGVGFDGAEYIRRLADCLFARKLSSAAGIMASLVFDSLAAELMLAPDVVESMLAQRESRHRAFQALERMGPVAGPYFGRLLLQDMATAISAGECFHGQRALGIVSRGQGDLVGELVTQLAARDGNIRIEAAKTLEYVGLDVCGREGEIVTSLESMLESTDERWAAIGAIASVGRRRADIRRRVVALVGPRPPEVVSHQFEALDITQHPTMGERAMAIMALQYFDDAPSECVPALIDAIDTFEEFDPDETYDGPVGRVSEALARFGPAAAGAVPRLVAHLNDDPEELPKAILRALAAIDPAAHQALPHLRALRRRYGDEDEQPDDDDEPVNEHWDLIGWTIQRIAGDQVRR